MTWSGIDEFVAVCDTGSFSAAARRLGCSISHISRAIADLEVRSGTRLFLRTTRIVRLTEPGRLFVDRCRHLILDREKALAFVSELGGEIGGRLSITCPAIFGAHFIIPVAQQFLESNPGISIKIDLNNAFVDLIRDGYDLAVRHGWQTDSSLITSRIASRRLYLCATPEYMRGKTLPRRISDLAQFEGVSGGIEWRLQEDGQDRRVTPKGRFQCNDGRAVLAATLSHFGISQLPDFIVIPHLRSGALISLLNEARVPDEPLWLVYPHREFVPPQVKAFASFLRARIHVDLE